MTYYIFRKKRCQRSMHNCVFIRTLGGVYILKLCYAPDVFPCISQNSKARTLGLSFEHVARLGLHDLELNWKNDILFSVQLEKL
jgi:hypothetical protein